MYSTAIEISAQQMFIKKVCSISNEKKIQSNRSGIPTQSIGLQSKLYYVNQQTTVGGGGRGVLNKFFYTGRLHPKVQPLTLLYTTLHKKCAPFVYLLLTNGIPFTYFVQNFASLFTAVNALLFKCVVPENIHTTPMEGICRMTPPPLRNFHNFCTPLEILLSLIIEVNKEVVLFTRMPNFVSFPYFLLNCITGKQIPYANSL